jgi:hypothetical protein
MAYLDDWPEVEVIGGGVGAVHIPLDEDPVVEHLHGPYSIMSIHFLY